jgi:RNA polymerase sigma factor (TIGR02999 family)
MGGIVMGDPNFQRTEEWYSGQQANTADERKRLDILFSLTYEELRRLAATVRRGDPSLTLNTTALVNEAWLKLAGSPNFGSLSRLHFMRIAARAMRQLLIEAARRRAAGKRGAGALVVTLGDIAGETISDADELLALDAALEELAQLNPRQALMVEARFFGGLDASETAALLDVSLATQLRDWRAARAWLSRKLRRAP